MAIQAATHDFVVHGIANSDDRLWPSVISATLVALSAEPVKCTVVPDMKQFSGFPTKGILDLRGTTEKGTSIWVPEFRNYGTQFHGVENDNPKQVVWKGVADIFIEGDLEDLQSTDGTINCQLYLSPTPLASSPEIVEYYEDGTISAKELAKDETISWQTPFGTARLSTINEYLHDKMVGVNKATVVIKRPCIRLEVNPQLVKSLGQLLYDLQSLFDETLWLVSFLSQRRVVWYEAEAVFWYSDHNNNRDMLRAMIRRNRWLGYEPREEMTFSLVREQSLRAGLFRELLENYMTSPYHAVIRRALILLLVSSEKTYIENLYTSVYTALESLVFGLSKGGKSDYLVRSSQFERLRKRVRQVIQSEITDVNVADAMLRKLPELRRPPFIDQLFRQLAESNINTSDLWRSKTSMEVELRSLVNRRNTYIHQGAMEDLGVYSADIEHLRVLLQFWILRLLECPIEALDTAVFRYLQHQSS